MGQPRNESVTKIEWVNGEWKQTLLVENQNFGEALGMVWRLRSFMNQLMENGHLIHRTYYRLGRPH